MSTLSRRRDAIARRARLQVERSDWYRITNAVADEAEIWIYDEIGWFGITAQEFTRELRAIAASRIVLHLNSPGGDVFDGLAIYQALREHPATVETHVDALAASAASLIALAGDRVVMAPRAFLMIHEPYALVIGTADDMRAEAAVLDKISDQLAGIYAEKAGGEAATFRALMASETWLNAQEAVDVGLADEIAGAESAQAHVDRRTFDLSLFHHPPAAAAAAEPPDAEPTPEPSALAETEAEEISDDVLPLLALEVALAEAEGA